MQNKRINVLRTTFAVLLLAITIFSVCFTACEKFHECSGHDCPVCFVLEISAQNLKLLGIALALFAAAKTLSPVFKAIFLSVKKTDLKTHTLLDLKTKLNN